MNKTNQNDRFKTKIINTKEMHPILMQAFYGIPRSVLLDAWWLVDEPDFYLEKMPIISIDKIKKD